MWIDPEQGMTWEQITAKMWQELAPDRQADWQRYAAATGETWDDLCREAQARFLARFEAARADPTHPFAREIEFMTYPCGRDPQVPEEKS